MLWECTSLSFWNVPWVSNDSVVGLALFIYKPVPFYGQHTQKYLVMFDLLLSGGLHVWVRFLVTHACTHTHAHTPRRIFFSTEINVYSIPNILCMRVCVVLSVPSMRFEVEVFVPQCVCLSAYMWGWESRESNRWREEESRRDELRKTHACLCLEKGRHR